MLLRLIAAHYPKLIELALWIALGFAALVGYHVTMPLFNAAGAMPSPEFAWKIFGALSFAAIAFLNLAAITGPIATLLEIRRAVNSIEAKVENGARPSLSPLAERRDPTI